MPRFGYLANHEQYDPNKLLKHAELIDQLGFDDLWASDHFHPWFHTEG